MTISSTTVLIREVGRPKGRHHISTYTVTDARYNLLYKVCRDEQFQGVNFEVRDADGNLLKKFNKCEGHPIHPQWHVCDADSVVKETIRKKAFKIKDKYDITGTEAYKLTVTEDRLPRKVDLTDASNKVVATATEAASEHGARQPYQLEVEPGVDVLNASIYLMVADFMLELEDMTHSSRTIV